MISPADGIYTSAKAQEDNLGDLVLRKVALDWLQSTDIPVHVLVEGMPRDFVAALHLRAETVAHTHRQDWLRSLGRATGRGTAGILLSAGPQFLADRPRRIAAHIGINSIAAAVRLRGGAVAKVGTASVGDGPLSRLLESQLARSSQVYTVRDRPSAAHLGLDQLSVAPDIALAESFEQFGASTTPSPDRDLVSLSFRDTLPPWARQALPGWVDVARSAGLRPVLVTQVRRDSAFHSHLGSDLGVEVVAWPDSDTHQAQLEKVVQCYSRSVLVLTNRLHSALFGLALGARPASVSSAKVDRTLHVVLEGSQTPPLVTITEADPPGLSGVLGPLDTDAVLRSARERLDVLRAEIVAAFAPLEARTS